MPDIHIVWPDKQDVAALLALMTPHDLATFRALGVGDPEAVIWAGIEGSEQAWCALEGDEPLCIGGVIRETLLGDLGRPWMVSQPGLDRHKRRFLRESRKMLVEIRRRFPMLQTYVAADYPKSLRWLGWLGFAVGEPQAFEAHGGLRLCKVTLS